MRTHLDRIIGLKQHKRKPTLFFHVWYGNAAIDEGTNYAILKAPYEGWDVKIKAVK